MSFLPDLLTPGLIAFALGVTLLAGVVKGAVGFAMPLIMISGMGILLDPKLVIAGIILPIVLTNLLQVARCGWAEAKAALRDYKVYILIVCVLILLSAQLVTVISTGVMYLVLGIPVTLLCAIQLLGLKLVIPEARRLVASVVAGILSGLLGGLAGTWGPTTVLYLVAIETPKARQIVVQGVIYGLGSIMLLAGHLKSGVMNSETVWFSALLLLPALAGMWIGFQIQDRIDQATFRKATLAVLLIAGLNLIRRGLIG
ncbi:sulfite exporter TauE/SafE family protein [Vannielia litorea]|uniref:sulfite exporter TauE/SafE family protein n=1 Tax=Vannielia litorea TaxID=1217970 RepID=UPI001C94A7F9|nr:sulfite exporter TauE/SafE family protein [Vannielia litorea]MBY6048623.1 sulfite exporter TauE/SafE family protein [Vannielia litorea]MBY6076037.1 sulfite exporter TauE/SafE family protein [Vannielia litorea]